MKKIIMSLVICCSLLPAACSKTGDSDQKASATDTPTPSVSEQSTPTEEASAASMEAGSAGSAQPEENVNAVPEEGGAPAAGSESGNQ